MTNKEIALDLGTRILKAKLIVYEMDIELKLSRETGPQRRTTEQILNDAKELALRPVYRERVEELELALNTAEPQDLLPTLQASLEKLLR
jgi:hypothetical protein